MKDLSAKQDELSELPEPFQPRTVMDYVTWVVGRAVAGVVLGLLLIGLAYGNPRKVGPPHWSDRYIGAAVKVRDLAILAALIGITWKELSKYFSK